MSRRRSATAANGRADPSNYSPARPFNAISSIPQGAGVAHDERRSFPYVTPARVGSLGTHRVAARLVLFTAQLRRQTHFRSPRPANRVARMAVTQGADVTVYQHKLRLHAVVYGCCVSADVVYSADAHPLLWRNHGFSVSGLSWKVCIFPESRINQ